MRFYITLIILISLMTMINMKDHDNERSESRISITSRGIKFNIFLKPADSSPLSALCCVIRERPGVPCRQVRAADESNDRSSSREGQPSDETGPVIVDGSTPNKKEKQSVPTVPADATMFLRIENVQVDNFHPQMLFGRVEADHGFKKDVQGRPTLFWRPQSKK